MPELAVVEGTVAPGFESVRDAFAEAQSRDRGGAQLAVYRHGELVVDLASRGDAVGLAFDAESLVTVYSVSKGVTATCAAILVERGLLDPELPVAHYWPEYAAQGKGDTTVAHLLAHAAGLPFFPAGSGIEAADLADWERCTTALAGAAPLWAPGSATWYHPVTYGYLVGEVLRRVSSLSVGRLFAEAVADPLGLDFWIGLPAAQEPRVIRSDVAGFNSRVASLTAFEAQGVDPRHPVAAAELADRSLHDIDAFLNTREGRAMECPAANGTGTARSLARLYAACLDEVDGVRLFGDKTARQVTTPRNLGLPLAAPAQRPDDSGDLGFGLGYLLGDSLGTPTLGLESFGHHGAGGRHVYAHPPTGTVFAYTCTTMLREAPDPRWTWVRPLRAAVLAEASDGG